MAQVLRRCFTLGCTVLAFNLTQSFAHLQRHSMDKPHGFVNDDTTEAPSMFGGGRVGDPMGAGYGKGCSYVCEGSFDDIMDTWDDFST
jgi:hypothetical protein